MRTGDDLGGEHAQVGDPARLELEIDDLVYLPMRSRHLCDQTSLTWSPRTRPLIVTVLAVATTFLAVITVVDLAVTRS